MVQEPVLEGGDGADSCRLAKLGQDNVCQRYCLWRIFRRYDPNRRFQYAKSL